MAVPVQTEDVLQRQDGLQSVVVGVLDIIHLWSGKVCCLSIVLHNSLIHFKEKQNLPTHVPIKRLNLVLATQK